MALSACFTAASRRLTRQCALPLPLRRHLCSSSDDDIPGLRRNAFRKPPADGAVGPAAKRKILARQKAIALETAPKTGPIARVAQGQPGFLGALLLFDGQTRAQSITLWEKEAGLRLSRSSRAPLTESLDAAVGTERYGASSSAMQKLGARAARHTPGGGGHSNHKQHWSAATFVPMQGGPSISVVQRSVRPTSVQTTPVEMEARE
ncbi:hypothetical protein EMIHUDRAFT_225410 [Emiliania huxleyi CCMP1516]|uniref:Uncharacterized protein n=2 Tax=Emiliania huxleyi TaxID=2903 RepID=A0A0D3KP46_EMIH1|nr:hypothetical protein EMIHUDRAFT_225410 [Emiliania huxleyi CCMP1516]EOD37531.1 hypothetical protein EMIHUDRAFT_225410 [Emiliania huxleyi CCMP1516]|eukprot:XP_005789960.1 hypothetical protein EMIHUDRAFT_225410 [Emiliania huxleyi CCMP1516]